jgi:hypothetical protein
MSLLIRSERKSDEDAIAEVTRQAFAPHPYSSHTEHFIVDALRTPNSLTISLVAEQPGQVIGYISFFCQRMTLQFHPSCAKSHAGLQIWTFLYVRFPKLARSGRQLVVASFRSLPNVMLCSSSI